MEQEAKKYIILEKGERLESFLPDTLEMAIAVVRHLEAMIDRYKQHSPYTIAEEGGKFDNYREQIMDNETELTGAPLLMYLMSRWNMTREEALRNMKQHGHDTSNL